jgi:peroxiredoxin
VTADDGAPVRGAVPRLYIASKIDADGNVILSATEQYQKKVVREVERDGKKTLEERTVSYPVVVLDRQIVSLKDATIYDGEGKKLSLEQARERLKGPTPILLTVGDKADPLFLQMMRKETLTFTFPSVPQYKELPGGRAAERPARKGEIAVGDRVPDFAVRTLDGKTVKLSDVQKNQKGTKKGVVVLSFWCSTCSSCRHVERHLDKLARDYEGQAAVLALDANAGETAERVAAFAKEKGLALSIVLDPSGHTADVFGTEVTTTTVVIDGTGVLRYCGRFRDGNQAYAEEALKAVLAGKEVAVKSTPHDG